MKKTFVAATILIIMLGFGTLSANAAAIPYSQSNDTQVGAESDGLYDVPVVNPFTKQTVSGGTSGAPATVPNNEPISLDYVPKELSFQALKTNVIANTPLQADGTSTLDGSPDGNFVFVQLHNFGGNGPVDLTATLSRPFTSDTGGNHDTLNGGYLQLDKTKQFNTNIADVIYNNYGDKPSGPEDGGSKQITEAADSKPMLSTNVPTNAGQVTALAWNLPDVHLVVPMDWSRFQHDGVPFSIDMSYNSTIDWNLSHPVSS